MKAVYKCDYCYKFDEDSSVIEEHEKKCSYNPKNKTCRICEHYVDEGMPISGSMYVCQKGKTYDEVDVFEDEGGCDLWEEEI
jgi:hypothetical protein